MSISITTEGSVKVGSLLLNNSYINILDLHGSEIDFLDLTDAHILDADLSDCKIKTIKGFKSLSNAIYWDESGVVIGKRIGWGFKHGN